MDWETFQTFAILAAFGVYSLIRWLVHRGKKALLERRVGPVMSDTAAIPTQPWEPAEAPPSAPSSPPAPERPAEPAMSLEVLAARREGAAMLRRAAERRMPALRSGAAPERGGAVGSNIVDPSTLRPAELRRVFVLMTVLGPPRALDPARSLPPADSR